MARMPVNIPVRSISSVPCEPTYRVNTASQTESTVGRCIEYSFGVLEDIGISHVSIAIFS